jgi:hypothetical protein
MLKKVKYIFLFLLMVAMTACSNAKGTHNANEEATKEDNRRIVLQNDASNEQRNILLKEDIQYFAKEFPNLHKNPFSILPKDEFYQKTDHLIKNINKLNNTEVFVELNKIIASVGDAHTTINYWDGYRYPLKFWIFGEHVYVVNADTTLEEMLFSKVIKINGIDIEKITKDLSALISHENESWLKAMLPQYLESPVYMYGLGIIPNEEETLFTIEKEGKLEEHMVSTLKFGETADFIDQETENMFIGNYTNNYEYSYFADYSTLYFKYNACVEMESERFKDFNNRMFKEMSANTVDKIVIDLRNNTGGNSEILNPFTKQLKTYLSKNPDVKVYILIGRLTFSSGMFAIYRTIEAAPKAVSVGEPTGGAIDGYGEVKQTSLPHCKIPLSYSIKYFEFSKNFSYKNPGIRTFLPEVLVEASFEDYQLGNDRVLKYALEN